VQIVSTFEAASGRAGGFVASHGRAGAQLRARVFNCQPRSVSQVAARARTGGLAALWRGLTDADRRSWDVCAANICHTDRLGSPFTPTGYALFIGCNRNLLSIGGATQNAAPPAAPSFPPLLSFTAAPVYSAPPSPIVLTGFSLAWTPADVTPFAVVLRASAALSPARGNVRPSDVRIIASLNPPPLPPFDALPSWLTLFGTPPLTGQVTFELNLLDPASGFAAPSVRASAAFVSESIYPFVTGGVTISFEGEPVAQVPGEVIYFDDTPVAG
jgi:hypothetical protein